MKTPDAELLERITLNPEVLGGKPTIRGMRISVEQIVFALAHGVGEQALLEDYPELTREDIAAALLYAGNLVAEERVIHISDAA